MTLSRTEDPRLPPLPELFGEGAVTFEFIQRLLSAYLGDAERLQGWLDEYIAAGEITEEQARNIWEYALQKFKLAKTVGLPAGATFSDISQKIQMRRLTISPQDLNWLSQGIELENKEARVQAEIRRGFTREEAIAREPEEPLGLREKFQRAKRYEKEYRTFVAKQLGVASLEQFSDLREQGLTDEEIAAFEPGRQDQLGGLLQARAGQVGAFERAARGRSEERITRLIDLDEGGARTLAERAIQERKGRGYQIPEEELRTEVWEQAGRPGFKREREEREPEPVKPFEPPRFRGIGGAPSWQRWFEDRYAGIIREFQEREPRERTAEAFGTFLEKRTELERAQWWKQGAFRRGERPSAFAPPIRTVRFR